MNIKSLICYKPNKPLDLELIKTFENIEILPSLYKNILKIKLQFLSYDFYNDVVLAVTSTTITPYLISDKNIEPLSNVLKETFNIEELTYDIRMQTTSCKLPEEFVTFNRLDDTEFMKNQLQLDFNIRYLRGYLSIDSKSVETLETVYHYIYQLYYNEKY